MTTKFWARLAAPLALFGMAALSGCGMFFPPPDNGGGGTTTCTDCLYAALGDSSFQVAGLNISTTGSLTSVGTNLTLSATATALAASPKASFLYVGSEAGSSALVYTVNSNGTLTAANSGSSVVTGTSPVSMAVDPSGNYLLILSAGGSCTVNNGPGTCFGITVVPISQSTGGPSSTSDNGYQLQVATSGALARQIYVSPDDTRVYVSVGLGGLYGYTFSGGTLTNPTTVLPVSSSTSVNGLAMDSASKTLYAGLSGTYGGLFAYTVATGKTLTGSPFVTGDGSTHSEYAVVLSTNNTYVYVSNAAAGTITGYAVATLASASNSTPAALTGSPYTSSSATGLYNTIALAAEPTGKFILAANALGSPDISSFTIGSDGSLGSATDQVNLGSGSASGAPTAIAVTGN